jgi:hypothetical protein
LILWFASLNQLVHINHNIMCWTSNHQNIYRNGPKTHFPFNLLLFGDLCQHIKNQLEVQYHSKKCKLKTKFSHLEFGIFGSLLPPLGLFSQNKFFFLSLYQNTCFGKLRDLSRVNLIKCHKLPRFPIIKIVPRKRTNFCNKRVLIKHKILTHFWNSQVVGWSICFGLNFSPFGIKHQNGRTFGLLTPLPHQSVKYE